MPNVDFNFNVIDVLTVSYILVVDLDYPVEMHDAHNHSPLYPERSKLPFYASASTFSNSVYLKKLQRSQVSKNPPRYQIQSISMAQNIYKSQ